MFFATYQAMRCICVSQNSKLFQTETDKVMVIPKEPGNVNPSQSTEPWEETRLSQLKAMECLDRGAAEENPPLAAPVGKDSPSYLTLPLTENGLRPLEKRSPRRISSMSVNKTWRDDLLNWQTKENASNVIQDSATAHCREPV